MGRCRAFERAAGGWSRVGLKKGARAVMGDQIPPFTEDNAIFHLVGAGRGGGQEPGRDKHAILDVDC